MKLQVIAVGKLREAYFKAACDEYAGRIRHFLPIDECEVPSMSEVSSNGSGKGAMHAEAEAIVKQIPQGSKLIALDIKGKTFSSEQLSQFIQDEMLGSTNRLCFVIGGAWGLAPSLLDSATLRLSFSPMTFPHELARVMLYEQLYRALSIWKNLPYHK
ncbi:MAG: 23S rRNA (pseudouridine(1915)-N(3))-methyltransferase RlmH [Calditrichaeota bacterium]|nr:23S rRNA (pseudouridine(1915)-N(3))-methyltransferase RlmH [Calditrichota bacterium]MCB9366264.1 23S rRNA (pseudouridine(1915)-N(3))-methyltransferase RlmH [Calditrichota bacterium]MCB9391666.1 23S rRNA (pseudouridine(1915)-N(3))-methyltransferase RlmH [Calditrichota bacterium]